MAYEVLARKWRPRQFAEVVGQEHVTRTLENAIKTGRIAHAYLFVGPRGIGKTSLARIFAKALNCRKGPTVSPCDECPACREIMTGSNLDVIEIDGASNNKVEHIRDLRDTVGFLPATGQFKIYIIDEVHMLTSQAFNALLKTLEEPPPHVKFIFATTEADKVLTTIVSRCQRFDLRRIPVPSIVRRLQEIADAEKIKISGDALLAVARGADGGLRDAESALDQLIAFKGKTIEETDVLAVFGLVSRSALHALGTHVLRGDAKEILASVAAMAEAGKDFRRVLAELMGHLRNLLVYMSLQGDVGGVGEILEADLPVLKADAALATPDQLLAMLEVLSDAEFRLRTSLSPRTMMETLLLRCARCATTTTLEQILARLDRVIREGGGSSGAEPVAPAVRTATAPAAPSPVAQQPGFQFAGGAVAAPKGGPVPGGAVAADNELAILKGQWAQITEAAGRVSMLARQYLLDAHPLAVNGADVVIGVEGEFAGEARQLELPRNRKAVEQAVGRVLGRTVKVVFEAMRPAAPAGGKAAGTPPVQGVRPSKGVGSVVNDEVVQQVLREFGGTIVDVKE